MKVHVALDFGSIDVVLLSTFQILIGQPNFLSSLERCDLLKATELQNLCSHAPLCYTASHLLRDAATTVY
jgi:hypothetical protein